MPYKEDGDIFRAVSRQTLFAGSAHLPVEVRCFEVDPDGWSTLERHEHIHAVLILQGEGRVLLGDRVEALSTGDFVHIPPLTWHQFQPVGEAPLSFLCLVSPERDRPQRPSEDDLIQLRENPQVAAFIKV